jgi:hypothetical protein
LHKGSSLLFDHSNRKTCQEGASDTKRSIAAVAMREGTDKRSHPRAQEDELPLDMFDDTPQWSQEDHSSPNRNTDGGR